MPKESVFKDEWRECLRAHYMDVCRRDDQRTLKSLVRVMHDTGFTDDELAELRVRATMRADEMPDDFVPDMRVFQVNADLSFVQEAIPTPDTLPQDLFLGELAVYDDRPETVEEEVIEEGSDLSEEVKPDPDAPQQLSLF